MTEERKAKAQAWLEQLKTNDPDKYFAIMKETVMKTARIDYATYCEYIHSGDIKEFVGKKSSWQPYRLHKKIALEINRFVQEMEEGKKPRWILSMPPRHGKSHTITETLPSYILGRHPSWKTIITSAGDTLAERFGDKNRSKVEEKGQELFHIKLSQRQNNKQLWRIEKHGGECLSVPLGGMITGSGANLVIIDDPFKNSVEAGRKTVREMVWDFYTSAILTRLESVNNGIILIQTRWHDDDLAGRLERYGWRVLNFSAVCDDEENDLLGRKNGETLLPELGYDEKWAEETHRLQGERNWFSLYQGKPMIEGGNIFKKDTFKFYDYLPDKINEWSQSWDLAFKKTEESDFVVGLTWARKGGDHYLVSRYKKRASFTETVQAIKYMSMKHPKAVRKYIEDKANGSAVIDTLKKEFSGIIPINPKSDKVARAHSCQALYDAGNVFLPNPELQGNEWVYEYINTLLEFPKGKHDDDVDATTQYLNEYAKNYAQIDFTQTEQLKGLRNLFG